MDNTILLVDDEAGIRKVLGISLRDRGYTVHTAENAETALRMFKAIGPPIVLTDIKMPDMDGIELLRRIKKENTDTEVIMFTGHGDMDLAIKSLKYEATDFVTKPINDDVLDIALKRALERMTMRRQLREYTENLERLVEEKARRLVKAERMAAVGQTVTELSHTIKSIANALKGSIFVLGKGVELDDKNYVLDGWRMVEANVQKIMNLSLDLLDYGKYADLAFTQGDPNNPVREVAELMASKAAERHVKLKIELNDALEPISYDAQGMHRCLLNLVSNAIDACEKDEGTPPKNFVVTIKTSKINGGGVEYLIMDNGRGMDQSIQDKLFQSFFSTKGTDGTGIGLMMTKKIVDQHNGSIDVKSKKGLGSTFCIRLPASSVESL